MNIYASNKIVEPRSVSMKRTLKFSDGFIWGVATSAYQIEGAWNEDGKGESIWDRFCHTPGNVLGGDTGDVACDHYHRWREDVELMKTLGIKAYRFSVSWPRILPKGREPVNQKGLDFYCRLVDGLLAAGIEPFLTLYHWDLPQALQDEGGWPNRAIVEAFLKYTEVMARALGDRVQYWLTINEPYVTAFIGYLEGRHAPGHRNLTEALRAAHHQLLAHALATVVIREYVPQAKVGIVLNLSPVQPASRDLADRRLAWFIDAHLNRWFLDPLAGRGYPVEIFRCLRQWKDVLPEAYRGPFALSPRMNFITDADLEKIAVPLDFIGINYYTRAVARSPKAQLPSELLPPQGTTDMGWEVYPQGLFELLARVHFDYRFPAYLITENGAAFADELSPNGAILDESRIRYLQAHLCELHRAISQGIPVHGYFVWSFLDNFEWAYGYSKRFGLVYVDYVTQRRIPKASAHWYAKVIEQGGLELVD